MFCVSLFLFRIEFSSELKKTKRALAFAAIFEETYEYRTKRAVFENHTMMEN